MAPCRRLKYHLLSCEWTQGLQSNPRAIWEPWLTDPFLKYAPASKPDRKVKSWWELGEEREGFLFSRLIMKHFIPNQLDHCMLNLFDKMDRIIGLWNGSLHQFSLLNNQTRWHYARIDVGQRANTMAKILACPHNSQLRCNLREKSPGSVTPNYVLSKLIMRRWIWSHHSLNWFSGAPSVHFVAGKYGFSSKLLLRI